MIDWQTLRHIGMAILAVGLVIAAIFKPILWDFTQEPAVHRNYANVICRMNSGSVVVFEQNNKQYVCYNPVGTIMKVIPVGFIEATIEKSIEDAQSQ